VPGTERPPQAPGQDAPALPRQARRPRAWPPRRPGPASQGALAGLLLGLLALGPGLSRGYLLSYDMVAVPRQPFTAAMFGLGGGPPRAVPSDAVAATAARVLPADVVQKLLLLSIFVLACSGLAALLAGQPALARLAGAAWYAWNPFVAERLILGQWAMLLGYGALPWVLRAVTRDAPSRWRWAGGVALALLPAAVGGFTALGLSALAALPAAAARRPGPLADERRGWRRDGLPGECPGQSPGRLPGECPGQSPDGLPGECPGQSPGRLPGERPGQRADQFPGKRPGPHPDRLPAGPPGRAAAAGTVLLLLAGFSLPWLIPGLMRPVHTSPAGVAAFAARADTPFGAPGSLLMLGGTWNAQTVPAGYGGPLSAPWLVAVLAALAGYLTLGRGRWPGLGPAAVAGLALACAGLTAPGQDLLRVMIGAWPGFAVLRDGQQFVAPLALAEAAGAGLGVAWLLRLGRPASVRDTRYLLAAAAVILPVVLLPGLAWGAAGRLRPVAYPANWLAARAVIDRDRVPGSALLLPWGAYRRFPWNHGEAVLDPWPRLLQRPVIWDDGVQVGRASIPPEDPRAIALSRVIATPGPLTSALRTAGVRYVIVDAGGPDAARLPDCRVLLAGPGLVVYQVPSR
jgi:hypothetical protein